MKTSLQAKRVLVTGASSGIGRSIALEFAKRGAHLVLAARRTEAMKELAAEIVKGGGIDPVVIAADLSKPGAAHTLAKSALTHGAIDVLVNNAGVSLFGTQVVAGDSAEARALMETNYWAPVALAQALVPQMVGREGCAVVNISSVAATATTARTGHYSSSKAALSLATETLSVELRPFGIQVLHVMPGPVETAMLAEAKTLAGLGKLINASPRGTSEQLAKMIANGLKSGRETIIYPRLLWMSRVLPGTGRSFSRYTAKKVDLSDKSLVACGSHTVDSSVGEARRQFESNVKAAG